MPYRRFLPYLLLSLSATLLAIAPSHAQPAQEDRPVFGWVEYAIVMPAAAKVKVKLDSGALTSSMDARDIEIIRRDGKRWVRFVLHLEDRLTSEDVYRQMELPLKRIVRLRGAGGEDRRPTVEIPLCIGDKVYTEEFTLRDRDNMLYPVLLGRTTLQQLGGLLDVNATFTKLPSCPLPD